MKRMRITNFGEELVYEDAEVSEPTGSEVLLETAACGVCHSDLHVWEGFYSFGGGKKLDVVDTGVQLPLTPGHEIVGRVRKAGPDARGVQPGDLRLVYPWTGCGSCNDCTSGNSHLCDAPSSLGIYRDGGYQEMVIVPDAELLVDIGDLSPEIACSYACAGLTAYSALKKALPLSADDGLVIIGAGGVGLFAAQVARYLTDAKVVFVDIDDSKLASVRSFSDRYAVVNSANEKDAAAKIREVLGGEPAAVVDFVNNSATAVLGFSLLRKNGKQIFVGLFGGKMILLTPLMVLKTLTLAGSFTGSLAELKELMALVAAKKPESVPIQKAAFADANVVLNDLREGRVNGRAVLCNAVVSR